jgi:putative ABC transport system permease protein
MQEAARLLLRARGQSALAVVVLAVGIGFTVGLFSVVRGSFFRSLPFPDGDRIVKIERRHLLKGGVRPAELEAWRDQTGFEAIAAWFTADLSFTGDGVPAEGYQAAYVTAPFFTAVGVKPVIGRTFRSDEDREGVEDVVVISYRLWSERYGRSPKVLGQRVRNNSSEASTIIGVMPEGFRFPQDQDAWLPLGTIGSSVDRNGIPLDAIGRLKPGVTPEQAGRELDRLASHLPLEKDGGGVSRTLVRPFVRAYGESAVRPLWLMSLAGVGVLLIACANVANLLLARGALRERELAVRIALGAGRRDIGLLVLGEVLLLSLLGGVLGLVVAKVGIGLYNATGGLLQASWIDIRIDPQALLFTLVATLAVTFLAGILPAVRSSRVAPHQILKEESAGGGSLKLGRMGKALVVAQIALSCALLSGTGQMIDSVRNLDRNDLGAEPDKVWVAFVGVDPESSPDPGSWLLYFDRLLARLREVPGVRGAAFGSSAPGTNTPRSGVEIDGIPFPGATARWSTILPGFFATLGRPLLEGRDFGSRDRVDSLPVVIVNRSFARRYLQGRTTLGHRIRIAGQRAPGPWLTVVGVAPDLYLSLDYFSNRVDEEHREGIYLPFSQKVAPGGTLMVRTAVAPAFLERAIRKAIADVDPNVPPLQPSTVAGILGLSTAEYRRTRSVLSVFGLASFLLAGVGLYGVVSFLAGQRRREMAIRMALGATGRDIVALVVWGGLRQTLLGIIVGVGLAVLLSRSIRGLLYEVRPGDSGILAASAAALVLLAVLACLGPALRSARTDPAASLRGGRAL